MHNDEFIHDVFSVKASNWVYLSSFKMNREKIDFYNKNTDVLESILKEVEKGKKLGTDLLKKRITTTKRANIRKFGKDAVKPESIFNKIDESSLLCDQKEAEDLSRMDNPYLKRDAFSLPECALNSETLQRDGCQNVPDDGIQVDCFETDGVDLKKSRFYTQAEVPVEPK
jgi:hypothetical protein